MIRENGTSVPDAADEDAATLMALVPPKRNSPWVAAVLDDTGERYRLLLEALARRSQLVVFVESGVSLELGEVKVRTYEDRAHLDALLVDRPARDLFLDLRQASAARQLAMWLMAYFHVRDRGVYVHNAPTTAELTGWSLTVALTASSQKEEGEDFKDLARSTRWVRTVPLAGGEVIAYRKSRRHLYLMHDHDAATLLPHRTQGLELDLIGSVPATTVTSRATVRHHGATIEHAGFDETFEVPDLHVWHYRGPITLDSHMLTYRGHSVLPPSFRFPARRRLFNPRLRQVTDDWAWLPSSVEKPKETLEGDYYDLNAGFPRMFGHVMTQSVHKLWAWDDAKRRLPGLKALAYAPEGYDPEVERTLFGAYGIDEDDLCFFSEPVRVESYVSPTIIWEYALPCFASELAADVWRRIRRGLGVDEPRPTEKVFVSRRDAETAHRACRNTDEVEDLFAEHGFTIVYPEDHPLARQAEIFAGADVLAGFGGSAMFNMMYGAPGRVIVLNHEGYRVRNEHLYTSLLGCTVDYFWSAPDIPQPEDGWTKEAFASPWEFDFARNGAELTALLEGLAREGGTATNL